MADVAYSEVNDSLELDYSDVDDNVRYIDYIVRLYFFDKTYLDGTIISYNSDSITIRYKDNNKKTKTFNRTMILDLKVLNIPKTISKNNKKSSTNLNSKKNGGSNNRNDSTFGMIDINSIKNNDFNFEDSNSKYDYNRVELKSQSSDEVKYNDEERNDLIVAHDTAKKSSSDDKKVDKTKAKKTEKKTKKQAKAAKDSAPVSVEKKPKKKQESLKKDNLSDTSVDVVSDEEDSLIDIDSLPITKSINLSHLCDLLNSESVKRQKLKKKMKKKKQASSKKPAEEEVDDKTKISADSNENTGADSVEVNESFNESTADLQSSDSLSSTSLSGNTSFSGDSSEDDSVFGDKESSLAIEETLEFTKQNVKNKKKGKATKNNATAPNQSSIDESLVMKILLEKAVKAGLLSKETAEKQQLFNTAQLEENKGKEKSTPKAKAPKDKKQQKKIKVIKKSNTSSELDITIAKDETSSSKKKSKRNKKKPAGESKKKSQENSESKKSENENTQLKPEESSEPKNKKEESTGSTNKDNTFAEPVSAPAV